jgi:N-acetylglucosaminyl-diphospho-decaprenol L-rhamnosyltransferase
VAAPEELELSVVLVNYNGADCLPAALGALARHTETESVEGIVVDSGSTDGSWQDVPKLWDKARAIRFDENIGFCAGCNRGAEAARGRLLAFVNFDSLVEEDWDRPLRELLEDESVAVATGLMLTEDGETLESVGLGLAPNTAAYGRQMGMPRSAAPEEPIEVAAASGGLMMVRRSDFLALDGFYEPIFMYGEEADYCLRVPGRVVLHPGSASRHESGHASGPHQSPLRLYWSSRNRLLNAARHLSAPALVTSVLASGAFDVMTLAQARSRPALSAIARGWRDGLRLMAGERRARPPQERREATRQLASFREALAEQRRLGRLGWAGRAPNRT